MKNKTIPILACLMVLIQAGTVFAHKVIIFAWVEEGMIFTESSFGSKRKAKNCPIIVVDETGRVVHRGETGQEGEYAFKIPENVGSDLILELEAGTGHKARWRIPKAELVSAPSAVDRQAAMTEKEKLEQQPSVLKIFAGIGIIFLLALAARFFKRKKTEND